jgi:y4mF family transcriptional regulator
MSAAPITYPKGYCMDEIKHYYTLSGTISANYSKLVPKGYKMEQQHLAEFVVHRRKALKLTQAQLADKVGVGLRFVRELEASKPTLRMDKVNEVLRFFGSELGPVPIDRTEANDTNPDADA